MPEDQSIKPGNRLATATSVKAGSTCTALVDGTSTTVEVARDLTVAVGDVLFVSRFGAQWYALARVYATAPVAVENDPVPDPKPSAISGTLVISPVYTGSWDGTRWRTDTTDVYQGIYGTASGNHTGSAFYGDKPTSLAGATISAATIAVRRIARGTAFGAPVSTMRLVTDLSKPVGAPTLSSSTTGPALSVNATDEAFAIPVAWAQAMVDGTAGGIAFFDSDGSPFVAFAGSGSWGPAFSMTVNWSK